MWLATALTSGLPTISAPKRPAVAPPLFPCLDKVYGSHTGLRECPEGRGRGYDLWFSRAQASSDPGITAPGESASDAPANMKQPFGPTGLFGSFESGL
jgi:hypothetical protein